MTQISVSDTILPDTVVMVRPHFFYPNPVTASDNHFQTDVLQEKKIDLARGAYAEVSRVVNTLREQGIKVCLFEDETEDTPDSIFPNNWFSTHADGRIVLYPMYAENRRAERRADIIGELQAKFNVTEIIDMSALEDKGVFLEGTGSMVLDHAERRAYAALSNRTHKEAFVKWCAKLGYAPIFFDAVDRHGAPIYHTNVMMCVGQTFAMIGLEAITNQRSVEDVRDNIEGGGKEIIELTMAQIEKFAGNAFELRGKEGRILALSQTAFKALGVSQIRQLEAHVTLVPMDIPIIEMAGGSVRCMLAGIHLDARS